MARLLSKCPDCLHAKWMGDDCANCQAKPKQKKEALPKFVPVPLPTVDKNDPFGTIVRYLKAGFSPKYMKSILGNGYYRIAKNIQDELNSKNGK